MSVRLTYGSGVTVEETLETGVPAQSGGSAIKHNGYNTDHVLNASSTPPATKSVAIEQALTAGAATVDLVALTGTNGATVNGTGLRVQCLKFRNKSTNGAVMSIAEGSVNGYDGFGAGFDIELAVGAEVTVYTNDAGGDILEGVISGRALYDGKIDAAAAVALLGPAGNPGQGSC